jgi:hypothetical protein
MNCVESALEVENGSYMVVISPDWDPDDAWVWIRIDLEAEVRRYLNELLENA